MSYTIHGKALHEAVQAIREEEPAPLSAVHTSYRGDIDTIVTKALEKASAIWPTSRSRRGRRAPRINAQVRAAAQGPCGRHRSGVASTREAVRAHKAELVAEEMPLARVRAMVARSH